MKIDGREIAKNILDGLRKQTGELKKNNITPHLAIILVGNDPASVSYINQKELKAENVGVKTTIYNFDFNIQNSELINLIHKLNADKNVHGIIVQRPLPNQVNKDEVSLAVDPGKDVDGFNPKSCFQMPIAMAVLETLKEVSREKSEAQSKKSETNSNNQNQNDKNVSSFDIRYSNFISWLRSKNIVIIGKGETGGKPIINALQKMGIEPKIIDSSTINPELLTRNADIIITAAGKANILKPQTIKQGVILIGIGISRGKSAKLTGDYDQNEVKNIASFYTPTPGGIGPINVACLLKNVVLTAGNFNNNYLS